MKKTIYQLLLTITVCFFLAVNSSSAQTEFAPIGTEWYFSEPFESGAIWENDYQKYVSEKDTMVAGKNCRLISNRFYPPEIIYQENGSVYYYYMDDFRKIFDFAANVGDTIDFEFKCWILPTMYEPKDTIVTVNCKVDSITTHTIDGQILQSFHTVILNHEELDYFDLPENYSYTEKFGFRFVNLLSIRRAQFIPKYPPKEISEFGSYRILRCFHDPEIDYMANWWIETGGNKPCDYSWLTDVIHEKEDHTIRIYPNPGYDQLQVQFSGNLSKTPINIALYDQLGKLIAQRDYAPDTLISIDISNLTPGVYFLKISSNNNLVFTDKLIKL